MLSLALAWAFVPKPPTSDDVLSMMARIPNECALYDKCPMTPAGFERSRDARRIANVIADGVKDEDDPWGRAALATVYVAFESDVQACPRAGDGGHSHGGWQLWDPQDPLAACNPRLAFPLWMRRVRASETACAANPPDERLAQLASGSCTKGRVKVRKRAELAKIIVQD
jgi:hypothetical protein